MPLPRILLKHVRDAHATVAALLIVYAALAWSAHLHKSPTYDEPYHAMAGWTHLWKHDFRLNSADPPLWQYWAALPDGPHRLSANFKSPDWVQQPQKQWLQWIWCVDTLYRTPGNNPAAFMVRQQAMMLILAVALGALIAYWAWRLGSRVGAIVATALFALSPNFLGYGPLVKNDVVFSLAMLALVYSLWRLGDRLCLRWAAAVGLASVAMATIKFSGVIAALIVPAVLLARVVLPAAWGPLHTRYRRLMAVIAIVVLTFVIGVAGIWCVYGFRFSPTPDPAVRINTALLTQMARSNEYITAHHGALPTPAQLRDWPVSTKVRLLLWVQAHHLLPQAWLAGLLFTYQSALARPTFLLGHRSLEGWWYYFPFAMLVKTPIAPMVAMMSATIFGIVFLFNGKPVSEVHRRAGCHPNGPAVRGTSETGLRGERSPHLWAATCLVIPIVIYMAVAMRSNLNIGVRHVLPVYPLLMVGTGAVAAACFRRWKRGTTVVLIVLGIGLVAETGAAYPNYVAYFNVAAGGSRGGFRLLGDSNLDWGQDLPALVDWQRDHPHRRLYLAYFGLADPKWYGLRYTPLPGGYQFDLPPSWPSGQCTVAVSATYLQGILVNPQLYGEFYSRLANRPPTAVLNGTIYLFDLDAR